MSYTAKCYVKNILLAVGLGAVIFAWQRNWSLIGVSDACALSGICYLILALFRFTRYLRFYDLIIYGVHKFTRIWKNEKFSDKAMGSYGEFVAGRRYEKNYGETFIAAVSMLVCSAAVLGI